MEGNGIGVDLQFEQRKEKCEKARGMLREVGEKLGVVKLLGLTGGEGCREDAKL